MNHSAAAQYDALPYEGHPDPMIHPDRMAAVAWLHGVEAPPLENARILEIGCATGSHLIPIAYQLPHASCSGFDISPIQIAIAQASADNVGVRNIRFSVRDLRHGLDQAGEFDYILAHGIFSWIPHDLQDALLKLCRHHLAPTGIALVDYNVYPGWHLRGLLRDLVAFHHAPGIAPPAAVNDALLSLNYVASHAFDPAAPFARIAANLRDWTGAQGHNYLVHEFANSAAQPLLFSAFAHRAQAAGLQILGDAQISHVIPEPHAASVAAQLQVVAGDDYIRREQYLDFLRGRDFRRTLLVRDHIPIRRDIVPNAIRRLRFATVARQQTATPLSVFQSPDGATLKTANLPFARALSALCAAGPSGLMFDAILRHAYPDPGFPPPLPGAVDSFTTNLLDAAAAGLIQPLAHAPHAAAAVSEKPLANAIARAAAQSGRLIVTSVLQRDWRISELERRLLCLLDGQHDRPSLERALFRTTGVEDPMPNSPTLPPPTPHPQTDPITSALEWFARVGILIA